MLSGSRAPASMTTKGFSLIEVMLAVTILAMGLTVLVSDFMRSFQARDFAERQIEVQEVSRALLNRLLGAPTADLGVQPWAIARIEGVDTPLTANGTGTAATDLVQMGVRTLPATTTDLNLFVEYYRGIQSPDPSSGAPTILDGVLDDFSDTDPPEASYAQFRDAAWRAARRLNGAVPPSVQVPVNTPVLIRIVAVWNNGAQRMEFHGARLF